MSIKIKELEFQKRASSAAIKHLHKNNTFSFQSPTGSGKTLITGMIINNYLDDPIFQTKKTTFIFIAPSVGALDYQGYQKITGYLDKGWVSGFDTEYIGTGDSKSKGKYLQNIDKFQENTVYFIGWSLFGKNSNLTNIDSERNNLFKVIQNTKTNNTEIVLIIDEAHREVKNINSETKKAALNAISPIKQIEISATLDNPDYTISLKEVREECAIKKNVVVNTGKIIDGDLDSKSEIDQLISSAINKQKDVKEAYFNRNIRNKPLILIQIPDRQKLSGINTDDYYLREVRNSLDRKGYVEGYNYAIWLSAEKSIKDKKILTDNESPIEILIFKQAIATGWDLPRANILVRLREPKSPKFDIQTLGRILRNPFFKYFDNQLIDNAFVFTKDKKYTHKILKEKFITESGTLKFFDKSIKSQDSKLKLNKISFDNEIDTSTLISYITKKATTKIKKVFNDNKKDAMEKYSKIINEGAILKLKSEYINNPEEFLKKVNNKENWEQQSSWNFSTNKDDLFVIFLKYKSVLKNKYIESLAMDEIAEILSPDIKKKDFYKFIIIRYSNSDYQVSAKDHKKSKRINIIEYLQYIKNQYIVDKSNMRKTEFKLPNQFKYSTKFGEEGWDKLNSYELKSNKAGLDSEIERKFYKEVKAEFKNNDKIHLFRNGVGGQSYGIEYFNTFAKKSIFFPDFLLIDDKNKKVLIIDTKGRNEKDIDAETNNKFKSAWKHIEDIQNNYDVAIYKATVQDGDKWEFENATGMKHLDDDEFSELLK